MLLVVHARLAVAEPRALDPVGSGRARGVLGAGLLAHRQPGDAGGALGDRPPQLGQPRVLLRRQPPTGESLVDNAVPAATRHVAAAYESTPRPLSLAEIAGLDAEQLGLPPRVAQLVLGQRRAAPPGELDRLGHAVGGPVVGDRRPVVLDLVARRRQVGTDAIRRLAPALVR